ncbi:MAG: hypothetical protein QNK37_10900 [Acidobacteriota bacterium]|nr:hypothetical protein [Acidobacteriota bacterium]
MNFFTVHTRRSGQLDALIQSGADCLRNSRAVVGGDDSFSNTTGERIVLGPGRD